MANLNNPYSAPQADDYQPRVLDYAGDFVDASQGRRIVHLLIDYVAFIVLAAICGAMSAVLGVRFPPLLVYPLLIGYYVFFEGVFGATLGKMITGSRVVSAYGGKPTFGQVLGRTLIRFVPFEAFSFLGSRSGWHDRWSKTRVVRK